MPWYDILWNYDDPDGNVAHIAEHGLTPGDVEHVLMHPAEEDASDSTGRPCRFGYAPDGRYICVVYEVIDQISLYPVTAYVLEG